MTDAVNSAFLRWTLVIGGVVAVVAAWIFAAEVPDPTRAIVGSGGVWIALAALALGLLANASVRLLRRSRPARESAQSLLILLVFPQLIALSGIAFAIVAAGVAWLAGYGERGFQALIVTIVSAAIVMMICNAGLAVSRLIATLTPPPAA